MLFRGVVYIDKSRGVFNLKPANRAAMGKTKHSGRIVIQNPPRFCGVAVKYLDFLSEVCYNDYT